MNPNMMYYPCFAMLILTFAVLLRMFVLRARAIKNKEVDFRYFKTYESQSSLPMEMAQAGRNFSNLFEVPTLFYMVCVFTLITNQADTVMLSLAWGYVGLRALHTIIHLTNNKIIPRMITYFLSWLILLGMGSLLLYKISLGS